MPASSGTPSAYGEPGDSFDDDAESARQPVGQKYKPMRSIEDH